MKNLLILSFVLSSVTHFFSQDASLIYKKTVNSTVTIKTDDGSQAVKRGKLTCLPYISMDSCFHPIFAFRFCKNKSRSIFEKKNG